MNTINTHDPLSMTVLQSYNDRHCAKIHTIDKNGAWKTEGYANEVHWAVAAVKIKSLNHFWRVLRKLSGRTDAVVIRGALIGDNEPGFEAPPFVDRLKRNKEGRVPTFEEQPRRWVALDFDDVIVPDECTTDDLRQKHLQSLLPPCFDKVKFWWQWTSSYLITGDKQCLRARHWYLLDTALNSLQLDALLRDYPVDRTVFRTVSVNYISHPRFEGCEDPVGVRYGSYSPHAGHQQVPISEQLVLINAAVKVIKREHTNDRSEIKKSSQQISNAIERVMTQDADEGNRHYSALGAACELVGMGCDDYDVEAALEEMFIHNGREPNQGEIDDIIATANQYLDEGTLKNNSDAVEALTDESLFDHPPVDSQENASGDIEEDEDLYTDQRRHQINYVQDNPRLNAKAYLNRNHGFGKDYLYLDSKDYECIKGCWHAMKDVEVLVSRIAKDSPLSVGRCKSVAEQIRMENKREYLTAGSWLSDTDKSADTLLLFNNGRVDWIDYNIFGGEESLQPNENDFFQPSIVPYDFDHNAECPQWIQFLEDQWPDDPETHRALQKCFGYLMSGGTNLQKITMFIGASGSGKSVMASIINSLVGKQNSVSLQLQDFTDKYTKSAMVGKKVIFLHELNETNAKRIPAQAIDAIKAISGRDEIMIRGFRDAPYSAVLPGRIVMVSNEVPAFIDNSGALTRRLLPFFFTRSFTGKEDVHLTEKLIKEMPGIALWALDGLGYLENGEKLSPPASSDKLIQIIKESTTPLASFIDDHFSIVPIEAGRITKDSMYAMYREWCEVENHSKPKPRNSFFTTIRLTYTHVEEKQHKLEDGSRTRYLYGFDLTLEGAMLKKSVLDIDGHDINLSE